jgi:thiol:disulfide interchange protein
MRTHTTSSLVTAGRSAVRLVALLGLAGLGPAPLPAAPPQGAGTGVAAEIPSDWLQGAQGFARARQLSERSRRPLVLYVYTDWCRYCRELERELLDTAYVKTELRDMVRVRVNPEQGPDDAAVAEQYGVEGYPAFFVQPAGGAPVKVSRYVSRGGKRRLMTPAEFVGACRRAAGR